MTKCGKLAAAAWHPVHYLLDGFFMQVYRRLCSIHPTNTKVWVELRCRIRR